MSHVYDPVFRNSPSLDELVHSPVLAPFDDVLTGFVEAFSRRLMTDPDARHFPELMALAFWMRRSSLARLREQTLEPGRIRVARGTAFHVAPANVDTIFVYSWFLSLLCGNRNIVRVSSRESPQTALLLSVMDGLLREEEFFPIKSRSLVVRYGHDDEVNRLFSSLCDLRVVWGGDESVRQIRKAPLSATACEMTFANKYSFCVIDPEAVLRAGTDELELWTSGFYNDSYMFGQMACSSPRLVLWLGGTSDDVERARNRFWSSFDARVVQAGSSLDVADYVNKRVAVDSLAVDFPVHVAKTVTNDTVRVWLDQPALHNDLHCGAGLFFEGALGCLPDMLPLLSRKVQTVTYIGLDREAFVAFLSSYPVAGIDRVVPVGKALDFQPVWDGFDMPRMFLREISVL